MSDVRKARVLVTGGSGFVGANLVRRLVSEDCSPGVICRAGSDRWRWAGVEDRVEGIEADLRDEEAIRAVVASFRPDVVFHCAMTSGHPVVREQRQQSLATSVLGTANLLEAALESGVRRFVHLGSFLAYGKGMGQRRESEPLAPATYRGSAKAAASLWLRQFARETGLPAVELRVFSAYGPWEGAHRFVPTLLRSALHGKPLPLLPGPTHDWVFVEDLVDACLRAADADLEPGETLNVASGQTWSNEEVVEIARNVTGRPIAVAPGAYRDSPADGGFWQADISAARERLGWTPRHSLADGLASTVSWMQQYAEAQ